MGLWRRAGRLPSWKSVPCCPRCMFPRVGFQSQLLPPVQDGVGDDSPRRWTVREAFSRLGESRSGRSRPRPRPSGRGRTVPSAPGPGGPAPCPGLPARSGRHPRMAMAAVGSRPPPSGSSAGHCARCDIFQMAPQGLPEDVPGRTRAGRGPWRQLPPSPGALWWPWPPCRPPLPAPAQVPGWLPARGPVLSGACLPAASGARWSGERRGAAAALPLPSAPGLGT